MSDSVGAHPAHRASAGEHLVVQQRDLSVHCNGCGNSMRLETPVEIDVWLAAAKAFALQHATHGVSINIALPLKSDEP